MTFHINCPLYKGQADGKIEIETETQADFRFTQRPSLKIF